VAVGFAHLVVLVLVVLAHNWRLLACAQTILEVCASQSLGSTPNPPTLSRSESLKSTLFDLISGLLNVLKRETWIET
jgi:hypothetical protein